MTTLVTRAKKLRSRLEALDQTSSNVAEVSALEGLRVSLATRAEKLEPELANETLLTTAGIAVAKPASLLAVQKRAKGLLEKFQAETKAATLKRGKSWEALLQEVNVASRELATAAFTAWKQHRQSVFAGETPTQLRGKLARTPANDEALEDYEVHYTRLRTAFETFPSDKDALARPAKIAAELERIAKKFDFQVPAEVKQFLEAVLSVKGAQLHLLTPSVLEWLKENDGLDSYAVRATGR